MACGTETAPPSISPQYVQLEGKTMGTTYHITYQDSLSRNLQAEIDSLLVEINQSVSTYIDTSFISQFNQSPEGTVLSPQSTLAKHFWENFDCSKQVYQQSEGYFDVSIMPLVNYWGFGYTEKRAVEQVDSMRIDSMMQFVGMEKVLSEPLADGELRLTKTHPGLQFDFSALAKGYGIDAVGRLLEAKGIKNYLVEIGGEARARGINKRGTAWQLGINEPRADAAVDDFRVVASLSNQSMATSGNYRNYYVVDGVAYAHTINAKTGYPEINTLLGATVFAPNCMLADAYATACMTLGPDRAFAMIEKNPNLEAFFFYSTEDGTVASLMTDGARAWIDEL